MADPNPHTIRFLRLDRTSDSVRKHLAAIDQVRGVQGWIVGSSIGEVLFTSMHSTFNLRMLDTIGDHVVRSGAGVSAGEAANEMEMNFAQGNVLAQKIGRGWLMVFCDQPADLAMARMTLGVTVAALSTDKSFLNYLNSPVQSILPDTNTTSR